MAKKVVSKKYDKVDYKKLSEDAIELIAEKCISLSEACRALKLSRKDFYIVIKEHENIKNNYARACEIRCDTLAEKVLILASKERITEEVKNGQDDIKGIYNETTKKDNIGRTKIEIDAIKWYLGKMMPKKYGTQKEEEKEKDQTITINLNEHLPK